MEPTTLADRSFTWTRIEAKPDPQHGLPLPRSSHGVSYCQKTDTLFVYGGENVARTPIDDEAASIWTCSGVRAATTGTEAAEWQRMTCSSSPSATPPPSRIAHAQAMHRDRFIYIFGGRAGITMQEQAMNDLWVLDTETYTWTEIVVPADGASDGPPEPRSFHRMICINDNLYIFGGCGKSGRLNDLHTFDIVTQTWHSLGSSTHLRGRGGPNLVSLDGGRQLAVVAGFAGEETADGHVFDVATAKAWHDTALTPQLAGLRPRSVCVSAPFANLGVALIFGGEVDPSDRGHEGAGAFANDIVVLNERNGAHVFTTTRQEQAAKKQHGSGHDDQLPWPEERGWSDAASIDDSQSQKGHLFLFGGLSGDDVNPKRLNDLWRLDIS